MFIYARVQTVYGVSEQSSKTLYRKIGRVVRFSNGSIKPLDIHFEIRSDERIEYWDEEPQRS